MIKNVLFMNSVLNYPFNINVNVNIAPNSYVRHDILYTPYVFLFANIFIPKKRSIKLIIPHQPPLAIA